MNITLVVPVKDVPSETFIRAHIDRLSPSLDLLTGGYMPTCDAYGVPIEPRSVMSRMRRWWQGTISGLSARELQTVTLARRFRQRRADVVLAEFGDTGVAVMDACRSAGVPLVVHFHGYDAYLGVETLQAVGAYPALFGSAAALVVVSKHMQTRLLMMGAPVEKVRLSSYGVDTVRIAGSDPGRAEPVFLAVGRFVEKKAPLLTLTAFRELLSVYPAAKLVMAGEGPLLTPARQMAHEWGIERCVEFTGLLTHDAVISRMQGARAFVQHSVRAANGDHEGTPVAVLEACAAGLPVAATRHGGITDVVLEGETGLLCDEHDVAGMAANMLRLARDSALAARMGRAGRERICRHFEMQASIDRLAGILREAAGHGKPRAGGQGR